MWKNVVAPTLLVSGLWAISSIATTWYVGWMEQRQSNLVSEQVGTIRACSGMRSTVRKMTRGLLAITAPGGTSQVADLGQLEREFRSHFAEADATSLTPDERVLVRQIDDRFGSYLELIQQRPDGTVWSPDPAQAIARGDQVAESCKALSDVNERMIAEDSKHQSQLAGRVTALRYTLLIVGPTAGLVLGLWVSKRLKRSISRMSITLHDAASEMDRPVARIDLSDSPDLGRLARQVEMVSGRIRQTVEELHAARGKALAAARLAAIGELAAGVAHELRNPLTSVKLLVQTAAARPGDMTLADKPMSIVLDEIARMEDTLERLLDFARPRPLNRVSFDLRDAVRRARNLLEPRAARQDVVIVEELPAAAVMVEADPDRVHEAFTNLLQNGIEAMPGGGTLRISVSAADGMAQTEFDDAGPGIKPEVMPRLFEPFVTTKPRGTGLGLATARRIAEDHGGSLVAANRPRGGAVFRFQLPATAPQCGQPVGTAEAAHA